MQLIRYAHPEFSLANNFDDWFRSMFRGFDHFGSQPTGVGLNADLYEGEDAYHATFALPGLSKDEVNIELSKNEGQTANQNWIRPFYKVRELESGDYQLDVQIPGVSKSGVDVALDRDILTITATRERIRQNGWKVVFQELPAGDYKLVLTLNIKVDEKKISAEVKDGILKLTLPIAEAAKPRRIEVN